MSRRLVEPPSAGELDAALAPAERWFESRGWTPHDFQRRAWSHLVAGDSGLVHVPTGAGKTYAAFVGALLGAPDVAGARGVRILFVTPLRATSRDVEKALRDAASALRTDFAVGSRTGDTSASERARQRTVLPEVLVTTPESLSLLLAMGDARERFASLESVIIDEWHELRSSKRGVQTELALARLRRWRPSLRTWALSATLADVEEAARAAVGVGREAVVVRDDLPRPVEVESLLPVPGTRLPWAGHLGLAMREPLLNWLDPAIPTLLFTNTRSQAELWFASLLAARPEWAERLALHHGSIDLETRERIEARVKDGLTTLVVCTSSLDLGVDFSPVERVVQIGSPKGVARLLQRAGRGAHRPGATCRVLCVPTHAMELVEIAAAREAIERREIETRPAIRDPLDCLVQHLVTVGLGGGFEADDLFEEVRTAWCCRTLSRAAFDWCLDLACRGGATLGAYPKYHRLIEEGSRYVVRDRRIAALHRLNIGTITADATLSVRLQGGGRLGSIEERFIGRLRPGEDFLFAGRHLELVRIRDLVATVRPARRRTTSTPHWAGSRFPLSTALSASVRRTLGRARRGEASDAPELVAAEPILAAQAERSRIPAEGSVLAEVFHAHRHGGEGSHLFLHPFEGRLVHEGLSVLLALRFGRRRRGSFGVSFNDYGLEWWSAEPYPFEAMLDGELFSREGLVEDLVEAVNLGELSRRQFRDIARVAGLVQQKTLGGDASPKQVQAGASLLYEVFSQFDPENLLLEQSRREVLDRQCEGDRLAATLGRLERGPIEVVELAAPGPLAVPLIADRLGTTLSTESVLEQLAALGVARNAGGWRGDEVGATIDRAGDRPSRRRGASSRARRGTRR
jgi:ATP-dependent Lhr-like helicase